MTTLPLAGRRILVTRAAHQAGRLSDALRAVGAEPVEVPVIEIRPPATYEPLDKALRDLGQYDWLILTSANAVRAITERAATLQITITAPASLNVAAIGEPTAAAARAVGITIAVVPDSFVAEGLIAQLISPHTREPVEALSPEPTMHHQNARGHDFSRAESRRNSAGALAPGSNLAGQRILIARAATARNIIPDSLRAAGAQVDVVDAYQNILPESAPEKLREALSTRIDVATFTSSSSVNHLAEASELIGIAFPFAGVPAISIGPITSQTLRDHNWSPAAEATVSDIPGLVEAVVRQLASR